MPALTVYKASAGSGKTFTLALEFIKLLIDNPRNYESILAVTFTNKATEEMKHRIVSQLYGLSHRLPSSKKYLRRITAELGVSEDTVAERAATALHNLLHNYNHFRVQTIDAFFQSILRNMVKELGLGNNLRISLNDKQVISEAVDTMMETLDSDRQLLAWITDYITEQLDDNKSWNISADVKSFGMNLSKEFFKSNEHKLAEIESDPEFFKRYKKMLSDIIRTNREKYKGYGNDFFTILQQHGFSVDDLNYKETGMAGYFRKLQNGNFGADSKNDLVGKRVLSIVDDPKKWGNKTKAKDIAPLAESTFIPMFKAIEQERSHDVVKTKSAVITMRNITKMRLLFNIRENLNQLNTENSRFMLSSTQTLLNKMITDGGNIAPFIYEKIGAYLEHVMIDEFQDTSTVQWDNFKVLLENCMSISEHPEGDTSFTGPVSNLIVGDVKQSIYRFRSGDWRLLNDINTEFSSDELSIQSLSTNWRSERNVIEFNNKFFAAAAQIEADRIRDVDPDFADSLVKAYADVCQDVPSFKPARGLVKVEVLDMKNPDFENAAKQRSLEYVRGLVSQGVALSEIAILVRGNGEATSIAAYFAANAPELTIISEQAFSLSASPLVMMIVCMLKWLVNPQDAQSRMTLLKLYTAHILDRKIEDSELLTDPEIIHKLLPEPLWSEDGVAYMLTMSLYELSEYIYRTLSLSTIPGQAPYVSAFFDGMKKFMDENGVAIEEFLDFWERELCTKAIAIGGGNSIRVITIHKSKGLEFPHVVMPFCTWKITLPRTETLWCNISEPPFSALPFIPVNYTAKGCLDNSIFQYFGNEEWIQEVVDNLNLLYVAFTRAGRSLFAITNTNSSNDYRSSLICNTIDALSGTDELPGAKYENGISFGQHYFEREEDDTIDNAFDVKPSPLEVKIESYSNDSVNFRQSNKSRDFADDTLDDDDAHRFTTMGSIMHMVFSRIKSTNDIEKVLRQFEFDGVIYDDDISSEEFRTALMAKFSEPVVADWFSDRWTVFNECNIMQLQNNRIVEDRPDRVITNGRETIVIDYKFGKPSKAYKDQVKRYMELMKQMGYPNVHGFLWYVNLNKIVPVK